MLASARPGPPAGALVGASLVWIALLPLVAAAFSMSGAGGTGWIGPALLGGLLALAPGLLVGAARLGRAGLFGAIGGLIVVAAIPLAVFALGLARSGWLVDALPELLPGWAEWLLRLAIGAGIVALGVAMGSRLPLTLRLRAWIVVPLGLVILVGWAGFWILVFTIGPRAA